VVSIVVVVVEIVIVRISAFRKTSGGHNSGHASKAKLGKTDMVKISVWCITRSNVVSRDVTTKGDEEFVDSCQFLRRADIKRNRARAKLHGLMVTTSVGLLVCDIIETFGHIYKKKLSPCVNNTKATDNYSRGS